MPTPTAAKTFHSAAAERADYYATHFCSAAAALTVVDQPGHNDAFDREVNQELRTLAHAERLAAEAAPAQRWAA